MNRKNFHQYQIHICFNKLEANCTMTIYTLALFYCKNIGDKLKYYFH